LQTLNTTAPKPTPEELGDVKSKYCTSIRKGHVFVNETRQAIQVRAQMRAEGARATNALLQTARNLTLLACVPLFCFGCLRQEELRYYVGSSEKCLIRVWPGLPQSARALQVVEHVLATIQEVSKRSLQARAPNSFCCSCADLKLVYTC
jgi:hypothetical protein